jgi:beta-N-acetylhexosaminidase
MGGLTLEEKIGQMLFVGFDGLTAPDYILEWLASGHIGGIILFARNVASPNQLADLTSSLHQAAKYPVLIAIDQEGGTVARLRTAQGFTESPGAMALSAAQNGDRLAYEVNSVLAAEMKAVGINWTFAPAVDISYNSENPTVGTRSFGCDKEQVSQMTIEAVKGFQSRGVAACAKHFPGLGNTAVDTHLALPTLDTTVAELLNNDVLPYRAAMQGGVATVMTTHTIFTALDPALPATLSPVIVHQLLRKELGFKGVVCSDCMEMQAISDHYPPDEAVVLAALAGIDAILFSHTRKMQEAAYEGLYNGVKSGRVSMEVIDEAVSRITRLKDAYPVLPVNPKEVAAPEHLSVSLEAARAGVVLARSRKSVLPLREDAVLIEFASYMDSEVMENGGMTGFGKIFHDRFPNLPFISLNAIENPPLILEKAKVLTLQSGTLILATRNAHLIPEEMEIAKHLLSLAKQSILVCLRNPYDVLELGDADVVLCTCGDSTPSLHAAVEALAGDFTPSGRLPVVLG